jgi:hypothetical protein
MSSSDRHDDRPGGEPEDVPPDRAAAPEADDFPHFQGSAEPDETQRAPHFTGTPLGPEPSIRHWWGRLKRGRDNR